jgi:hypothetical protein
MVRFADTAAGTFRQNSLQSFCNEKSFEPHTRAKQFALSLPPNKKDPIGSFLYGRYSLYKIRTFFESNPDEEI